MGYVSVVGHCVGCGRLFSFHPHKVPSIRVNGIREPVCQACLEAANPERKRRGLQPIIAPPGAYEPAEEYEL
jgi:hypothetical protein